QSVPSGIENDIDPKENSKNDPKNCRRTAFLGTIPDAADNESLLSDCQTIIRPSRLKEAGFNTRSGSAVILDFVLCKEFSRGIKGVAWDELHKSNKEILYY
ncbi:hypothetical protein AVEN_50790-1, partial [Araneus ventricosus]